MAEFLGGVDAGDLLSGFFSVAAVLIGWLLARGGEAHRRRATMKDDLELWQRMPDGPEKDRLKVKIDADLAEYLPPAPVRVEKPPTRPTGPQEQHPSLPGSGPIPRSAPARRGRPVWPTAVAVIGAAFLAVYVSLVSLAPFDLAAWESAIVGAVLGLIAYLVTRVARR